MVSAILLLCQFILMGVAHVALMARADNRHSRTLREIHEARIAERKAAEAHYFSVIQELARAARATSAVDVVQASNLEKAAEMEREVIAEWHKKQVEHAPKSSGIPETIETRDGRVLSLVKDW